MVKHILISKLTVGMLTVLFMLGSTGIAFAQIAKVNVKANTNAKINVGSTTAQATTSIKVNASKNSSTTPDQARTNDGQTRKETRIAFSASLTDKQKNNVSKTISKRIAAYSRHLKKLNDRATNLETIALSLNATVSTSTPAVERQNGSTTQALGIVVMAKMKIAHASTTLISVQKNMKTALDSGNPAQQLENAKVQFETIITDIHDAHQMIAQAISTLRAGMQLHANAKTQ